MLFGVRECNSDQLWKQPGLDGDKTEVEGGMRYSRAGKEGLCKHTGRPE